MKNVYISTTFYKDNSKIKDVLDFCKKHKIKNLELGSNHSYSKNFLKICKEYKFKYLVHNYFPIPKKNFAVNIGSLDEKIRKRSISHIKKSIRSTKSIKSELYTFHPGFMDDPKSSNIQKKIAIFCGLIIKKNNYDLVLKK